MNLLALETLKCRPEVDANCLAEYVLRGDITFRDGQAKQDLAELSRLYMTIFNMNNIQLLRQLSIDGICPGVGELLWDEAIWNLENTHALVGKYLTESSICTVAVAPTNQGLRIIGFNAITEATEDLRTNPEEAAKHPHLHLKPGDVFYKVQDTGKLPFVVTATGEPLKGLGSALRDASLAKVIAREAHARRIIVASTTTNPAMLAIWRKSDWRIIQEDNQQPYPRFRGYATYLPATQPSKIG